MSREEEIATILRADAEFMSIVTGGVYTQQQLGIEGLRRDAEAPSAAAYDTEGVLKVTCLVEEGNEVPYGNVRTPTEVAVSQIVYLYFFEFRTHDQIDLAKIRSFELLNQARLTRTYPMMWVFETPAIPDGGPVMNSTLLRQDWQVVSIRRPS